MPHVQINRIPMYYEEHGHGKNHIVFIHGMGLSHINWTGQVDYFCNRSRILTYDLRGHGRSGTSTGNPNPSTYFDQLTDDLYQLLAHLNINKTFLVGYSTGTMIALLFMLKYPDMVSGAALSGAMPNISNLYLYSKFLGSYALEQMRMKTWLANQVARSNGADANQIQLFLHEANKVRHQEALLMLKGSLAYNILDQLFHPLISLFYLFTVGMNGT